MGLGSAVSLFQTDETQSLQPGEERGKLQYFQTMSLTSNGPILWGWGKKGFEVSRGREGSLSCSPHYLLGAEEYSLI